MNPLPLHDGVVVNQGALSKIQEPYRSVVVDLADQVKQYLGKNLQAIYIRGSVSTGQARHPYSDIDLVAVVREHVSTPIYWRVDLEIAFEEAFNVPFVDITVVTTAELNTVDLYHNLPIYLKTASALLFGNDVLSNWPDVRPGRDLASFMYSKAIDELYYTIPFIAGQKQLIYQDVCRPKAFACSWAMRVFLRSSLGLTMQCESVYSPDLNYCATRLASLHPTWASRAQQALAWALEPPTDSQMAIDFLNGLLPEYKQMWFVALNQ